MGCTAEPASLSQYAWARRFTCSRTFNTNTIRIKTGRLLGIFRISVVDLIWIKIRIHGYVIIFDKEKRKIVSEKIIF